jgi:hypothetical protein
MDKKNNTLSEQLPVWVDAFEPDKNHAHVVLSSFAEDVVTRQTQNRLPSSNWYTTLTNFISSTFMDGKGIAFAGKFFVFLAVLGLFAYFLLGTEPGRRIAQTTIVTPLPTTATPVPTTIVADTSVQEVIDQIDTAAAELDALQKELDALDASFSTKELDALTSQLDGIK